MLRRTRSFQHRILERHALFVLGKPALRCILVGEDLDVIDVANPAWSYRHRSRPLCVILQLQEHLRHIGQAELIWVMLLERMELARGDLVALDQICLGET
jgi:hypothetical protein